MLIRDSKNDFEIDVPAKVAWCIDDIQTSIHDYHKGMEDMSILVVIKREGANIILLDEGDFENCKASVFSIDENSIWHAKECNGTIELLQAMCPHIDIDGLIDKEG